MTSIVDTNKIGVAGVLINENKILMVEDSRPEVRGFWGPPHGVVFLDKETEEGGLKRKMLQEIGVEIIPIKRLYIDKADTKTKDISFWLIKIKENEPLRMEKRGNLAFNWFSLDEAINLKLFSATKKFLKLVKNESIEIDLA